MKQNKQTFIDSGTNTMNFKSDNDLDHFNMQWFYGISEVAHLIAVR
ncbi:hypothetical protein A8938_3495 [Algoriphagus zhangzhouensis]|uniref:Uncharacterized protein n=1 Tax=Algoriphagus zhangzhouensis TaxID=1073327 RepID=A0A1M7ZHZ4_9BACT|nr:hypothetical protein A8938_3495 [Algoriphagus zhangzhouensis]SHO64497.1 hypothetical protein SAMN04488108_3490 [Algoriphagus zhangzhouensis]